MPPLTQRRNAAYLNRSISRFGWLDRELEGWALLPGPDLRLISGARSSSASDPTALALPTWTNCFLDCAAEPKEKFLENISPSFSNDLCVLTVELSGARADV
jgi:hypothetical protein